MTSLWTDKLAQLFHDPFLKAWCQGQTAKELARWLGESVEGEVGDNSWDRFAQDKVGMLLSRHLLGDAFVFPGKGVGWGEAKKLAEVLDLGRHAARLAADLAASGADRPVLGTQHQVRVALWKEGRDRVTVTHPLCVSPLNLPVPPDLDGLKAKLEPSIRLLDTYRALLEDYRGEDRHRRAALLAWRRLPEDLAREHDGVFWPLQPADTRCPDHSIWDHLRLSSALAFLSSGSTADARRRTDGTRGARPWLLSAWVGPARDFLGLARTGRDLWTGSTLLSELAWALVEPVAEILGPDAVLYPDLRANPRADRWLSEKWPGVLAEHAQGTRASLIPNRFVAVVPEDRLDEITSRLRRAVETRWGEMAAKVHTYLRQRLRSGAWEDIFRAQVKAAPATRWVALPWVWDGQSSAARKLGRDDVTLPPSFPFQVDPSGLPEPLVPIERARRERFQAWIDPETLRHYQAARWTFLQTHPGYLLSQRGFDYALHHHKLLAILDARKRLGDRREERDEPGEKCSLCGARQALSNHRGGGRVKVQRDAARRLWSRIDPEGLGAERLCGPCAVRRFLSDAGDAIRDNWERTLNPEERGGGHAVPFPSTGLVAGQRWVRQLCERYASDPELRVAVSDFNSAFERSRIQPTQFVGALPDLRRRLLAGLSGPLQTLLKVDVQYVNVSAWERLEAAGIDATACRAAGDAASRIVARLGPMPTHLAVITLDGDRMGALLLGRPERVGTAWRDVLHPEAVEAIQRDPESGKTPAWKRAWRSTLEAGRLVGPGVHAFISRALRHFSNRVLPWVVEREFHGRLIYAGGDDALLLCPAEDALPLLQRLDELFTAPWVLDRHPEASTWVCDEPDEPWFIVGSEAAGRRF